MKNDEWKISLMFALLRGSVQVFEVRLSLINKEFALAPHDVI